MATYDRISARRGHNVNLDATFFLGGQPSDPYALYRIEIFRGSVAAENIVAAIDVASPDGSSYPLPVVRQPDPPATNEQCPTPPDCVSNTSNTDVSEGRFRLVWAVPDDVVVPDVYFDTWYYFATEPTGTGDLAANADELLSACHRFWIYSADWYVDGGLQTVRFGFEPLDIKFRKPERRPLELGIMPLPLYDYNYNLVAPIIPYLDPTISIWTSSDEVVVVDEQCDMKLRQGSFRSNPWIISYMLDTCRFFKGTFKYRVKVILPDGSSRVSGDFFFTVS